MPEADVRRLAPADLPLARRLNDLFGEAFAEPETYGGAPPADAYLQGLLAKDHVIVLVALDPAGIALTGGLVAYELDKLEQARREIYIYDLAVAEPHRRRGVAPGLDPIREQAQQDADDDLAKYAHSVPSASI